MLQETIDLRIRNCIGGALAAKSGMLIEHAMAVAETDAYNRTEAALLVERFADELTPSELDRRADQWDARNPMPPREEPETDDWIEWQRRRLDARNRQYLQELMDANGGDFVDHGVLIPELDA